MTVHMTDGTLFKRETSPGSGTFVTIAQVMNIVPPKKVRKRADVYIHDQNTPVSKVGAYEAMECSIELAYDMDASAHQQFETDADAKTAINYKIVFPNVGESEWAFSGTIVSMEPGDAPAEGTDPQTNTITFALAAAYTVTW